MNGYADSSVGAIARQAGVSTKTLYRLFPTKRDLLADVITDHVVRFFLDVDRDKLEGMSLKTGLEHILMAYGRLTLSDESVRMTRLVLADSERYPEIATAFYERAIMPTNEVMESWLRLQCERGSLRLADPHQACGMLRGMMIMEPQRAQLFWRSGPMEIAQIEERATECAETFLKGYAVSRSD